MFELYIWCYKVGNIIFPFPCAAGTPSCLGCFTICRHLLFQWIKTAQYRTILWHPRKISDQTMSLGNRFTPRKYIYTGFHKRIFPQCLCQAVCIPWSPPLAPASIFSVIPSVASCLSSHSISHLSIWWVHSSESVSRSLAPQTFLSPKIQLHVTILRHWICLCPLLCINFWGILLVMGVFLATKQSVTLQTQQICVSVWDLLSLSLPHPFLYHYFSVILQRPAVWLFFLLVLAWVQMAFSYCFHTWPLP